MVDLVIVSLVHQTPELVEWLAENIRQYVSGSFVWVVHYNGHRPLDRSRLPEWVWPVPDPVETQAYTPRIAYAIARSIQYAASRTTFTNILTMSSGSAFFRPYTVPTSERVQFVHYDPLFNPSCLRLHNDVISIERLGSCSRYLYDHGHPGPWQFDGFDKHTEIHAKLRARGFKWIMGSQWSGQLIPRIPALQFAEDMTPDGPPYVAEEVLLSTYSYNYAREQCLPIWNSETITKWGSEYVVSRWETIRDYRIAARTFPGLGHLISKVPDDPNHVLRRMLNAELP